MLGTTIAMAALRREGLTCDATGHCGGAAIAVTAEKSAGLASDGGAPGDFGGEGDAEGVAGKNPE